MTIQQDLHVVPQFSALRKPIVKFDSLLPFRHSPGTDNSKKLWRAGRSGKTEASYANIK